MQEELRELSSREESTIIKKQDPRETGEEPREP